MTRRTFYVTAIAAAAFCLLVAPASATHVRCGDTITTSTVLDSDVECAAGQPYGLIIGANDIVLRLNGYTVRGVSPGNDTGIFCCNPSTPVANVRIKGGTIEGFKWGIFLHANDSTVHRMTVGGHANAGISLLGERNTVTRSVVTEVVSNAVGIGMAGNDAYVWGNQITVGGRLGDGIGASGDRFRIVNNRVTCLPGVCANRQAYVYDGLIQGRDHATTALINRNTVIGNGSAGVGISVFNGNGAIITLNESRGHAEGFFVSDFAAIVGRNIANDNRGPIDGTFGVGIDVPTTGATVRGNTANSNRSFGIYVGPGVIDGGGNMAAGNGIAQCVNIACSSP